MTKTTFHTENALKISHKTKHEMYCHESNETLLTNKWHVIAFGLSEIRRWRASATATAQMH